MIRKFVITAAICLALHKCTALAGPMLFEDGVNSILARRCGACHGADRSQRKAELNLSSFPALMQGGESGSVLTPGNPDDSLLWSMIETGAMPPEGAPPLTEQEQDLIHKWIATGAKSNQTDKNLEQFTEAERNFWAFQPLQRPELPQSTDTEATASPIDQLLLRRLSQNNLTFAPPADRRTLCRRIYLDLIGIPPTPQQLEEFLKDDASDAYEKLVDQLLSSPLYGERWGQLWLDVVGYADSNGYIRHDSPRPLAYHYRDYVIESLNLDVPYDQFWIEQLAGDELVDTAAATLSAAERRKLIATHFLRNAPDGTDNSEGNEITRIMERYAVLEAQLQITMSSMFGMTIDCARCHSHKFDPIPQSDYYALQAIFYPAFNVKSWVPPKDRWIYAAGQSEILAWQNSTAAADREIAALHDQFENWITREAPAPQVRWEDHFSTSSLAANWSSTAPGDDQPAGSPPVNIDDPALPSAAILDGALVVQPLPSSESVWLVTRQSFRWAPAEVGDMIDASFDLVSTHGPSGQPAERIGYYIALHDYDGSSTTEGGNLLIDGNPYGPSTVILDYPGSKSRTLGTLGTIGYAEGHRYGVRIIRISDSEVSLVHLVDGVPDGPALRLPAKDLPEGGFGFELCLSRSFAVDHVSIAVSDKASASPQWGEQLKTQTEQLQQQIAEVESRRIPEPGKIAWATDLSPNPPVVPILKRGDYLSPGEAVPPGPLSILEEEDNQYSPAESINGKTTGHRLGFARWATKPQSRAAALLARVHADRLWRGHFGQGLVPTPENFGASGAPPEIPELLEWLAAEFVSSGWSQKDLHRKIVLSQAYRQSSHPSQDALERDPDNRFYSRYPAHRLSAEQIYDSTLSVAGLLNTSQGGPAIDFVDRGNRQIVVLTDVNSGPHPSDRRSIYIRKRRSQPVTFLSAFDAPNPEPNCMARSTSTVVAQSLSLLNGPFSVRASRQLAFRLMRESGPRQNEQIRRAFEITYARLPDDQELAACKDFLNRQLHLFAESGEKQASQSALAELCKVLLASNEFLQQQ